MPYPRAQRRSYLNKLPSRFDEDDRVIITDPMLATGGTILQVCAGLGCTGALWVRALGACRPAVRAVPTDAGSPWVCGGAQVVDDIVARGAKPENIRIIAVVVAPPAMVKLSEKYKGERPADGVALPPGAQLPLPLPPWI